MGLDRKLRVACAAVAAMAGAAASVPAWPQLPQTAGDVSADRGHAEFVANCAECHGADGKGAGPRSGELKVKPADLTILARRNHGVFAPGAVYQLIDGRHGRSGRISAEMPIWGCRHADEATKPALPPPPVSKHRGRPIIRHKPHGPSMESFFDLPCDSEAAIQSRLLSIVGYLSLIQQK
jgi:mono/diheme cytochrome c family protein